MDRLAPIIDAARTLSTAERRRLIVELNGLDEPGEAAHVSTTGSGLAALRALSATVHSDFDDLSTNKYAHVATAADPED